MTSLAEHARNHFIAEQLVFVLNKGPAELLAVECLAETTPFFFKELCTDPRTVFRSQRNGA